jgi:phosphopantetheinyl transferase
MNDEEQQLIYEAAEPDRVFTKLWTQKEAIVKAQGTGIESFEQLAGARNTEYEIQTFESKKYIYSIAFKQH